MKRFSIIAVAVVLFFTSCKKDQQNIANDISIPVSVMELNPELMEKHISVTGTVKPMKEAILKSQISGIYKLLTNPSTRKPYALGDYVKKGQELITLQNKEYENSMKLSSLKLNLEVTKQTYEKQQSLYEKGGVTLSDLKQAEINLTNAQYSYEDALIKLEKVHIVAPFSGVIVDLPFHTPDTEIEANKDLVKLMEFDQMLLDVNFSENAMPEVKIGQNVRVTNYLVPEKTLNGIVNQISPAIDPDTRSFKGNILVQNQDLVLKPGMYVKGEIIAAQVDSAIVIPKAIVQPRNSGNTVFVLDNGFARERIVQFGLENSEKVQILSGLQVKDRVIYKGYETLKDKTKVKIVN